MGEQIEEYASALAELTVNSKPIITSLTILAQEIGSYDPGATAAIAGLVEKHIITVRSPLEMFAFSPPFSSLVSLSFAIFQK